MALQSRFRVPSRSVLVAFESAARHCNFSKAARELGTSQAAVSRQIAVLEDHLSTRLFERSRWGVTLTDAGERFRDGVVAGLTAIRAGAERAASYSRKTEVVIACSHDASHLVMFPRFLALQRAVGEEVRVRLLVHRRCSETLSDDPAADLVLAWNTTDVARDAAPEDIAQIFREEIRLVCSPGYAATHANILGDGFAGWEGLTFLDTSPPHAGWSSWSDWFDATGGTLPTARYAQFDSYLEMLEAAATGQGVAMGWRHYIEAYLDSGALVALDEGFVEFANSFVAVLTASGRENPAARSCLAFFGQPFA